MRIRISLLALIVWAVALAATAQTPFVQMTHPVKDGLVGDTVKFCVTFDNTGSAAGYAPFIDLVTPRDPNNGPSPCDGISIVSATVTSTNPPVPLTLIPTTGCAGGPVNHPFAAQLVQPLALAPGQELVTIPLPFGSFQPSQPAMFIEIEAKIDPNANLNAPLVVYARGGFRYGSNPGPGPTIVVPTNIPPAGWASESITPRIAIVHNDFGGADLETVPGPNFPQQWTVTIDVAPNQVLTGLRVQECLPSGGVWIGTPVITPAPANWGNAGSCFAAGFNPITGTGAGTIVIRRFATIDNLFLPMNQCLKPMIATATIANGTWQPNDPFDPLVQLWGTALSPAPASTTIQVRALAVQKSAQPASRLPGSVITYVVPFQVSDFQRFGTLSITDTMLDGLQFNSASLVVGDRFGTRNVPSIAPVVTQGVSASYTCPPPNDGCKPAAPGISTTGPVNTRYVFDISAALQGPPHNGVLTGGQFAGSGGPARGTLTIQARVLDSFLYGAHAGQDDKVDKDDPLLNRVDIKGTVPGIGGMTCGDDSFSCLAVPNGPFEKHVVAVNLNYITPTTLGGPSVTVGSRITFRLSKMVPSSDFELMEIEDWYPLPPLQAVAIPMPNCSPSIPVLAVTPDCYDSVFPLSSPTLGLHNNLKFDFGIHDDPANAQGHLKIYNTLTIKNTPFADGLLLTNEAQECESNSWGTTTCQTAIAQFKLQEPFLKIEKRVCGGSCQNGNTTSVCAPCPTTTFNSSNVGNIMGTSSIFADANDIVRFAIAVTNSGTGPNGAFDVEISDALPTNFPGTINYSSFCVRRGDGAPVPWSFVPGTNVPKSFKIKLTNPIPAVTAPNGGNVILIMYSVQLNPPATITMGCFSNAGHIAHYANEPGGPDFVTAGYVGPDASAQVCIQPHDLKKRIVAVSEADPVNPNVTIGEMIDYELSVVVPEGTSSFTMTDPLPSGLQFDPGTPVTVTGLGFNPGITTVPNSGTVTIPKFVFTNVVNPKNDPFCERLAVKFRAQVMNNTLTLNSNGVQKINFFTIGNQTSNSVTVTIVEPKLSVTKTVTRQPGTSTAQYQVVITNISTATAFDITVVDSMPACMSALSNLVVTTVPAGLPWTGSATSMTISKLKAGQSVTIAFSANQICEDCTKLENRVRMQWTSEPGPRGTLNATPGISCAVNGERCGNGNANNPYFATATASLCGKVCGVKYADLNGNGVRDPNEPGLAGWAINSGQANTTTDATGSYCMWVRPGMNNVCEATVPLWTPTQPAVNPPCVAIPVPMNTTANVNFGNKPLCSATVCGKKTTPAPNAQPVAGWIMTATPGAQGGPVITATTQANGSYCMILFAAGPYTISEAPRTGWLQLAPASGTYVVTVECNPAGVGVVTGVPNQNQLDFVNRNVCAKVLCPAGRHCEVGANGAAVCVNNNINTE